jgi:hypothetical protein
MAKLVDFPDVFGSTVFCDDTRIEATGKLIHIGVYHGVMSIHVPFPVILPSFSFAISFSQRISIFNPKITYRIFLPGDPDDASSDEASIVAETNEANPGDTKKQADSVANIMGIPDESRKFFRSFANMAFQTLEIKQPGTIKVRADVGDNRYRLGSLIVASAPAPQSKT